ncbi:MAG: DUF3108 domain-containing protein [Chromatiales bacterium]|nr:DUF3108 domain-containing protein [Chromatiales bacterium]
MMQFLRFLAAPLLVCTTFATAAEIKPFSAHYSLSRGGLDLAAVTISLREYGADRYVYESETLAVGLAAIIRDDRIVERSEWQLSNEAIRPLAYSYSHFGSEKNRNATVNFDWQTQSALSNSRGKVRTIELSPGALDKFLVRLALSLDLQDGRDTLSYQVADGGKLKEYRFTRAGEETIETALGEITAIKVKAGEFDRKYGTTFWLAPKYDYLPVRVERTERGALYRMDVEAINGLDRVLARTLPVAADIQPNRSSEGSLGASSVTSGGKTVDTISQESSSGI